MGVRIYDAIVVGSGATGGWAAKQLAEKGLDVLVLEAGPQIDPKRDYKQHYFPYHLPFRGFGNREELERKQPIQSRCYACNEYGSHFFVNDLEHPYTTPPDRPFLYIRGRQVGGRTLMWGRQSYRMSDYDFKAASRDGWGEDWPIEYKDLAPYYDLVERFIGVSGMRENLPQLPDGIFLPPMAMTCGELKLKRGVEAYARRIGNPFLRVTIGRTAVLTRKPLDDALGTRKPCHYCGRCESGCHTGSYFSSLHSTLPAALRTGRATLVTDAVVSHIVLDRNTGRAKGVYYVDAVTRAHREVFGRMIFLCAGALESTRILLNSRSLDGAEGICNSSGVLGHYLMDHLMGGGARGIFPDLPAKPLLQDGRPNGIYIPRFVNLERRDRPFLRGYGYQGGSGQSLWQHAKTIPGFGADFKRRVREEHPWGISLGGFGEVLPYYENHVRLNKDVVDAFGIPVLHIDVEYKDNEKKMVVDMGETAAELLEAAGAKEITISRGPMSIPGQGIHECGTARMGNDPRKSVLNKFNQAHDIPNIFVTDGACYVSIGTQNPTLTYMAITARACDYAVEELRAGRL
jgi:choline dehydrogenase-like flavoprotein